MDDINKPIDNEPNGENLEEKVKELQKQLEELTKENGKLKNATTNASADASKWKKEYQAKLTEAEKLEAEQKEQSERLLNELNSLKRDKTVSEHVANFLSVGYSEELAKSSAEALADGTFSFADMKKFIEAHDKEIKAENVKNMPKPTGSDSSKEMTKEQFNSLGLREREKLFVENRELYNKLSE